MDFERNNEKYDATAKDNDAKIKKYSMWKTLAGEQMSEGGMETKDGIDKMIVVSKSMEEQEKMAKKREADENLDKDSNELDQESINSGHNFENGM